MKYFLIAGEASGDLHGSNLMKALNQQDPDAEFKCFGGNLMEAQGGKIIKHYRDLAFMGFIPVLLNLRTIFKNLAIAKREILAYQPDVLILIDYPGFNLKIAKYIKTHSSIPVYYYISPKVWAWKEYRVKWFKKYVDKMFCILPFEVPFFRKHNYVVNYVGNPTVDAVEQYKHQNRLDTFEAFVTEEKLNNKPIIALLAGSRKHEIKDNLPSMLRAVESFDNYQIVLAGAPGIEHEFYDTFIEGTRCKVLFGQTYRILSHSYMALVTSGTATLETALFRVPQVVCYKTILPYVVSWYFKHMMTTPYISLVNLIGNRTIVKELFAKYFSIEDIRYETSDILNNKIYRKNMLDAYDQIISDLGKAGASEQAATKIIAYLRESRRIIQLQNELQF